MFGLGNAKKYKEYVENQKKIAENLATMQADYQKMIDCIIPIVENYEGSGLNIIEETIGNALDNAMDREYVNKCIALKPQIEKALELIAAHKKPITEMLEYEYFEQFNEELKTSAKSLFDRIEALEKTYQEKLDLAVKAASTTNTLCSRNEKFEETKRIIQEQQEIRDKVKALNDKADSIEKEINDPGTEEERKQILLRIYGEICVNFKAIIANEEKLNYYLQFK